MVFTAVSRAVCDALGENARCYLIGSRWPEALGLCTPMSDFDFVVVCLCGRACLTTQTGVLTERTGSDAAIDDRLRYLAAELSRKLIRDDAVVTRPSRSKPGNVGTAPATLRSELKTFIPGAGIDIALSSQKPQRLALQTHLKAQLVLALATCGVDLQT